MIKRFQKYCILLLLYTTIVTCVQGLNTLTDDEEELFLSFKKWKQQWNKSFKGQNEELYRFRHNSIPDKTWEMGLNKFSDLSDFEFDSLYLMRPMMLNNLEQDINLNNNQNEFILHKHHNINSKQKTPLDSNNNFDYSLLQNDSNQDKQSFLEVSQYAYDPDYQIRKVEDQGSCGSCWAFATVGSIETARYMKYQRGLYFSKQQALDCVVKNWGFNGGTAEEAYQYLYQVGLMRQSEYPYFGNVGQCCTFCPNLNRQGRNYILADPSYTVLTLSPQVVSETLPRYGALVAYVDASLWRNYKGGIFSDQDDDRINHLVQIFGLSVENGKQYYLLKNSWGTDWGLGGYMKSDVSTFQRQGRYSGTSALTRIGVQVSVTIYPICSINKSEPFLFVMEIAGLKIMTTQGFPLSNLLYLQIIRNPQKKMKLDNINQYYVQQENVYMNNTVRFDLQFLQYIDFNDITYYLIQNQSDIQLLNYLLKIKTFKPKIICTQATKMLGQHYVKEIYELSERRNRIFYDFTTENYFKEQEAFQLFEDTYNNNFQEFTETFPSFEFESTFINYGQILKIPLLSIKESLTVEATPNGLEIGGANYILRLGNYFKIILGSRMSLEHQQICKSIDQTKYEECDYLLLGYDKSQCENPTEQICEILQMGKNIVVPFMDYEYIIKYQNQINDNISTKCHQMFIISSEFYNYLQIANSLVEFLDTNLQSSILTDPPINPLNKLMSLIKTQKLIVVPSIQDIKFDHQSIQATISTLTPSVYFLFDSSLRLQQYSYLFSLLDQSAINQQTNIYTQQQDKSYTFALYLTDPQFHDEKLYEQFINQHKCKVIYPKIQELSQIKNLQQFPKIKQILTPDSIALPNILQYKMLQKIPIKINQIDLPIELLTKGEGKQTLCNVELSKINLQLSNNDGQYVGLIHKQPHTVTYTTGQMDQQQTLKKIIQLIINNIPNITYDMNQMNICMFKNIYSNKTTLILKMEEHQLLVYSSTIQELNVVYGLVNKELQLRQF